MNQLRNLYEADRKRCQDALDRLENCFIKTDAVDEDKAAWRLLLKEYEGILGKV